MTEGINTDKVIVNAGGGGHDSGLNAAVTMAALGNRNQGNDNAALIAALGNRNDDSGNNAALFAALNNNRVPNDGFGMGGMGGILGIAALGLIFGRNGRGGLFGGGDGDGGGGAETRLQSNADTLAILNGVAGVKDAVSGGFATTALALSQGFANVKDSQQASTFLLSNQLNNVNQNVSEQGCRTREVVQAGVTSVLQALAENKYENLKNELLELRGRSHARESEGNITQTVTTITNQQQQQQQLQATFDDFRRRLHNIEIDAQVARATNANLIIGSTGVATGQQTANPVNVK